MPKLTEFILFTGLTLIAIPGQAFAYVDPGTGSFLISILVSFAVGIMVFFRSLKQTILSFFQDKPEPLENTDEDRQGS